MESRITQMAWQRICILLGLILLSCSGCGATKSFTATEQLLMSDAVDATVAKMDFTPLANQKVYLDATYVKTVRSPLLIDSDYVISSLRQQMMSAGVQLTESREQADLVAEARMGALGLDGHQVTYGLPASNALTQATNAIGGAPILPSMPEIALARHEAKSGAAKLAVFAYDRKTRQPIWQSGIAKSSSTAEDTWVLGVGPWQSGTIYEGTRFAGSSVNKKALLGTGLIGKKEEAKYRASSEFAQYYKSKEFEAVVANEGEAADSEGSGDAKVQLASGEKEG